MNTEYLLLLIGVLAFPLVMSRDKNLQMYKDPGALVKVLLLVCIPYWIWDVIATGRGHWSFNAAYVLDFRILGMPLEEWLFFPVIVFVAVFTWESTKYFLARSKQ